MKFESVWSSWQLDVFLILFSIAMAYDPSQKSPVIRVGRIVAYIVAVYQFLFFACPVIRGCIALDYSDKETLAFQAVAGLLFSWIALLWLALSLVLLKRRRSPTSRSNDERTVLNHDMDVN
ncbi:MAG: hypothetical protein JNL67_02950 [Planctomycetaceae bacterium]|nr:hypothetical protein [Planctomycetaceae bacterium]